MLTSRIFCLNGGIRPSPAIRLHANRFDGVAAVAGLAVIAALSVASAAHAGTGGSEFSAVNNRIIDMGEGGDGKFAAGLGLVAALAASVIRFNIWAVIGAFGDGAIAEYGLPIAPLPLPRLLKRGHDSIGWVP